jgi:hypothetical protein
MAGMLSGHPRDDFNYEKELAKGTAVHNMMPRFSQDLSRLIYLPLSQYSQLDASFVDHTIPLIVELFVDSNGDSPDFLASKEQLFDDLLSLAVAAKLPGSVLRSINFFFAGEPPQRTIPTNLRLTRTQKADLVRMELPVLKGHVASAAAPFVEQFYRNAVFTLVREHFSKRILDFTQIASVLQIFCSTYHLLNDSVAVALAKHFAEHTLRLPQKLGSHCVAPIIEFLQKFAPILEEFWRQILTWLIEASLHSAPSSDSAIGALIRFARGVRSSDEALLHQMKDGFLRIVEGLQKKDLLTKVYRLLAELSARLKFTVSDLCLLLSHGPSLKDECGLAIVTILAKIAEPTDVLCCKLLSFNVFSPLLHVTLLELCDDDSVARALFAQLLEHCSVGPTDLKKITMGERLSGYISGEIADVEANLVPVCYLLSSLPRTDLIYDYLGRAVGLSTFSEGMIGAMVSLFRSMPSQDAEQALTYLFHMVVDQMGNAARRSKISPLTSLLIRWIDLAEQLAESALFQKLSTVDFGHCPDCLPAMVTALAERSTNKRGVRQFVLKLMKETVPTKHARWAIELLLASVQDDRKDLERIGDQLLDSVADDNKRSNAVHLLYWIAVLESDFMELATDFCFVQDVILDNEHFGVPLHPFNSTRRLYVDIARIIGVQPSRLRLVLVDKDFELPENAPLSLLSLHWQTPLVLKAVISEAPPEEEVPDVLRLTDYIGQPEKLARIFQCMRGVDADNEVLFQVLTLFGDGGIQAQPNFPFQVIFKRSFLMSFEYSDSIRIFPLVIKFAVRGTTQFGLPFVSEIMKLLVENQFDFCSMAIACSALAKLETTYKFDRRIAKLCLIDCLDPMVRDIFVQLMAVDIPKETLLGLMHLTMMRQNRNHTSQYFQCLEKVNIEPHLIDPFFADLVQFEAFSYSDADETFIGLLSLLLPTEENVHLAFDRLFATPTTNLGPFAKTIESRSTGLEFLLKAKSLPQLRCLVKSLPLCPKSHEKLCDDIRPHSHSCIVGPGLCPGFLQILNGIEPFAQAMLSTTFQDPVLQELNCLFGALRYGIATSVPMPSICPNSFDVIELVNFVFGAIDRELGPTSILPSLFECGTGSSAAYFQTINLRQITSFREIPLNFLRWPKFLLLNLRGLTRTFQFPLVFKTDKHSYSICGILCKESNDRCYSIVSGANRVWYLFDHGKCQFLDISDFPNWCFENSVSRLLVYSRRHECEPREMTAFVKDHVNAQNMAAWPLIVCSTPHFVHFVTQKGDLQILFRVFTGVICRDQELIKQWVAWFTGSLLQDKEAAHEWLNYCWNDLGSSLLAFSSEGIKKLFISVHQELNEPFRFDKMATWFDEPQKPSSCGLVCDCIIVSLEKPVGIQADQLKHILGLLKRIYSNFEEIHEKLVNAFDTTMNAIAVLFETTRDSELLPIIADSLFLDLWIDIAVQSPGFLNVVRHIPLEMFSQQVRELLVSMRVNPAPHDISEVKILPYDHFCELFRCIMFGSNAIAKAELRELTLALIEPPRQDFVDWIARSLAVDLPEPAPFPECAWSICLLAFLPPAIQDHCQCDEYITLMAAIFLVAPTSVSLMFPEICELFLLDAISNFDLFETIHHVLVFDRSLVPALPGDVVKKLLGTKCQSSFGIQMLFLLQDFADASVLSGSCIKFALRSRFDENCDLLLTILNRGLAPCEFDVPPAIHDPLALRLVTFLWGTAPAVREKLKRVMKYVLRVATPGEVFRLSASIQDAMGIVGKVR